MRQKRQMRQNRLSVQSFITRGKFFAERSAGRFRLIRKHSCHGFAERVAQRMCVLFMRDADKVFHGAFVQQIGIIRVPADLLFRDIFGYGTISLPAASGLVEIPLLKVKEGGFYPGIFWATIPGALVIIALSLAFYVHVLAKFNLIKEQEESNAHA